MYRMLPLAFTLLPALASADAPDLAAAWSGPYAAEAIGYELDPVLARTLRQGMEEEPGMAATAPASAGRNFDMEVNFRGRYMQVPESILSIWFYTADEEDPAPLPRPKVHAYAAGFEYVVKGKPGSTPESARNGVSNGIFYIEFVKNLMKEGYWDDREETPTGGDHTDGDYLVPSKNLGLFALGANYAFEAFLVHPTQTNGNFAYSLVFGGGLGLGILVGDIQRWGPKDGQPAYERYELGVESDGRKQGVPRVAPILDVNAGMRFTFGDRGVVRIEGGVHDMLYYGASVGLMF